MIGENEKEDKKVDGDFLTGFNMPRLPDAAQRMLASSNSNTTNSDSRGGSSGGGNRLNLTDVSGLTVTGTTVNNNSNTGGTFDANSNDVVGGWDRSNNAAGDIVKSDGTPAGTTRETF